MVRAMYRPDAPHLPGLHGLRGLAALAIVVLHLFDMPPLPAPPGTGWLVRALHFAVMLFFVLSALCLLHAHASRVGRPRWVADYAIKRFFRIAPLFYAALLFTLAISQWRLPAEDVLLHLTFLFNLSPQWVSSFVPAGWAVGVEMLAYLAIPAALVHVRTVRAAAILFLACLGVSTGCRLLLPELVSPAFALWFVGSNLVFFAAGALVWRALIETRRDWRPIGWASIATLPLLAWLHTAHPTGEPDAVLWALPLGGLCAWQASAPTRWLASRPMQWIGERSFSVYLLHPFLIAALAATEDPVVIIGGTAALVLPLAALGYAAVERPGQAIGRALIGRQRSRLAARAVG